MTGIMQTMIGRKKLKKNVFLIYNGINTFFYGRKFRQK